jgi:predicted nicotinamide N-methyase
LQKTERQGKGIGSGLEEAIRAAIAPSRIRELIQSSFPLTPVPDAPEIQLHKAGPGSGLWRFAEADKDFDAPYWAYHWGGGLALARYILDRPATVIGKHVLDLGAGSGLVAIAAAKSGAASVLAADVDPYAIVATELNAAANGIAISTALGDLTCEPLPEVDIVLVGDLFYEADLARRVSAFLDRCLASGVDALIGDPWRAYLPKEPLELLAEYPGVDFGGSDNAKTNAVFAYRSA